MEKNPQSIVRRPSWQNFPTLNPKLKLIFLLKQNGKTNTYKYYWRELYHEICVQFRPETSNLQGAQRILKTSNLEGAQLRPKTSNAEGAQLRLKTSNLEGAQLRLNTSNLEGAQLRLQTCNLEGAQLTPKRSYQQSAQLRLRYPT